MQPQETAELERNYKDSVFVTVFHEKDKLIELYNAIFDTNYGMDTAIDIVTIKDVLFRTLKNDVSFVLDKRFVVLVEHQSTINGNLPLRDLLYIATVLKRMIDTKQLYREKTLRIPRPSFIVLYNGSEDIPAYQELRLSNAYLGEKEEAEEDALQLIVKVYNINTGKNAEILKKCETLRQYSRFVEIVRSYGHIDQLSNAVMVQIMAVSLKEKNTTGHWFIHFWQSSVFWKIANPSNICLLSLRMSRKFARVLIPRDFPKRRGRVIKLTLGIPPSRISAIRLVLSI